MSTAATEFLDCVSTSHTHREDVKLLQSVDTGKPWLKCGRCDWELDVYSYVTSPPQDPSNVDYFLSSLLAERYARWTGDINVPVSFHLAPEDFEGILASQPVVVPLKQLSNAVQLQRLLNAPFVSDSLENFPQHKIIKNFLQEWALKINKEALQVDDKDSDSSLLIPILQGMHQMFLFDDDIFEFYRDKLVPYVKECARWEQQQTSHHHSMFPLNADMEKELKYPLSMQLLLHWKRAAIIRRTYSKFSFIFDVIHVINACYACSTKLSLVANLAFDYLGRMVRGDFFHVETLGKQLVRQILEAHVSYRTNPELYYVIREVKNGRSMDGISTLLPKLAKLQALVKDHMPKEDDMALQQAFPAVLFERNADYLGFTLAVTHVLTSVDAKGRLPKGVYATARNIHQVVKSLIEKMNEFNSGPNPLPWTFDVFTAFLASDQDMTDKVRDIAKVLLVEMPIKPEVEESLERVLQLQHDELKVEHSHTRDDEEPMEM